MTSTFRVMKFNYKVVYRNHVHSIEIESCKTISNLITELKIKSREYINNYYDIEVVEAGNEMSPKLEPSEMTLEEKYGNRYNFISFYIRPVVRGTFIMSDDYSILPSQH